MKINCKIFIYVNKSLQRGLQTCSSTEPVGALFMIMNRMAWPKLSADDIVHDYLIDWDGTLMLYWQITFMKSLTQCVVGISNVWLPSIGCVLKKLTLADFLSLGPSCHTISVMPVELCNMLEEWTYLPCLPHSSLFKGNESVHFSCVKFMHWFQPLKKISGCLWFNYWHYI
jgi:hypothetical protein